MTGSIHSFRYEALPMRVVFGSGTSRKLGTELDRLGLNRVLVLGSSIERTRRVSDDLGERVAAVFARARQHVPVEVVDEAAALATEVSADGCVAVGGGSTIGLGKAITLRHGLPVVAIPTTYAGSEMTPVWGLTENRIKRTGRDPAVLPRTVIHDPELTLTLPTGVSVTSGLNAIAHAAEALYAPDASPIPDLMAEEGTRSIATALPRIVADPADLDARSDALRGAWLCGAVLGATTMSLHHKLCHILGGTFGLPHAETHTVVLPHALAFTLRGAPRATAVLSRALHTTDVPAALHDLATGLGAPSSLAALGMPADGIGEVVRQVLVVPCASPREVTAGAVTGLLERAMVGARPAPC